MTLPRGWETARIGDLIGAGDVFCDGDWVESKDQDPRGDVRLIQLADVGDGRYLDRSDRFLTSRKAAELRCTYLQKGDVLIARMPDPLGRACIFPGDSKQAVTVVDVCVVRARRVDLRWLMWFVNAPKFRTEVASLQSGSTRKRISRGNLATLSLPAPPISEQHRIVAAIEQHLSRIDAGVAALEKVQKELARYRASVLKAACEGRLVPTEALLARAESRSFEPASELLARILAERRARWEANSSRRRKQYVEPAPWNATELPELPEGWVWATLDELGLVRSGNTPASISDVLRADEAVPWFRVADMNTSGNETWMSLGRDFLSASDASSLNLTLFEPRTIVFPKRGGAIATNKKRLLAMASALDLNLMGFTPAFDPAGFTWIWFQGLDLAGLSDGSNVPQINHGDIKPLPLLLPPLPEQHRIVAEVERRLSIADEVAATVEFALARAARLRHSVLKRAFEGRLVPQDPSDEPASVLLERIRAERARLEAQPKKRKRARS